MSESRALATADASHAPASAGVAPDPLAGDWSEGLPGPARAHGIPAPRLLALDRGAPMPPPVAAPPPAPLALPPVPLAPPPAPDAAAASRDVAPPAVDVAPAPPLDTAPPIADAPPSDAVPPSADAPSPTDSAQAPADFLASPEDPPPTPWSEPVPESEDIDMSWDAAVPDSADPAPPADAAASPVKEADSSAAVDVAVAAGQAEPSDDVWSAPAAAVDSAAVAPVEAPDDAWSAPPQPEPAGDWQAPEADADVQEVAPPDAAALPPAGAADWSSLSTGPDWTAATAPTEAGDSGGDVWGAPPPPSSEAEWTAAAPPAENEWAAPSSSAAPDWSAATIPEWESSSASSIAAPAPAAPAWNAPAVGASALQQLESEPVEAEPGAAQELFGAVPAGGMLAGDDDDPAMFPGGAAPEEGDSSVPIEHDDPDLPAVDERGQEPRAKPLAALRPPALGALEVHGEHRVAVHTRGGRTLRGSVRDVDLSKSQFPLVPQGGGEPETIYHSDVKAIFFMLAAGERPNGGGGPRVKVTFADGRVIEGVRDSADAKHGFFLVPSDAARTNTRRIYIAREATSEIKDG